MKTSYFIISIGTLILLTAVGCGKRQTPQLPSDQQPGPEKRKYVFALVAKSQSNPVFESARFGAEDAALEIGQKLGVDIEIIWRTPNEEDAQKQVEYMDQLALQGVSGISVSCTEAAT